MEKKTEPQEPEICVICAWRQDCLKKYSLAHGQRCLEFTRDLTLKPKPGGEKEKEEK